jgi:methanogenic corrinoid protein MtbC1
MLAHSGHVPAPRCPAILKKPSSEEVSALARLVLEHDASRATELVESLYCGGMTQEAVYLDLLGPTARYLGEMWEADLCDFIEVTIGLNRLHQVLRRLSRFVQPPEQACSCEPKIDRRILLALAPGEQHSFGLSMVEEIFRCAGWDVCGGLMSSKQNLPSLVNQEWFDAAGISAGSECRLDALTNCICAIRAESLNQRIGILVGGPFFIGHPELVSVVGADSTAGDAWQAVSEAEHLVALRR